MSNIDINRIIEPNEWELNEREDGGKDFIFLDAELDHVECSLNGDECIQIDTSDLDYIVLSRRELEKMIDILDNE